MPVANSSQPRRQTGILGTGLPKTPEDQRALLRKALMARPTDTIIKQNLSRLMSAQYVKQAAYQGVFISYTRADELFAMELSEDLRQLGVKVWLDMVDIPFDGDWHSEVAAALARCGLMLMIVSHSALENPDWSAECRGYIETGKMIIPVMREACKLNNLDLLYPPVDFRHDYMAAVNTLVRALL